MSSFLTEGRSRGSAGGDVALQGEERRRRGQWAGWVESTYRWPSVRPSIITDPNGIPRPPPTGRTAESIERAFGSTVLRSTQRLLQPAGVALSELDRSLCMHCATVISAELPSRTGDRSSGLTNPRLCRRSSHIDTLCSTRSVRRQKAPRPAHHRTRANVPYLQANFIGSPSASARALLPSEIHSPGVISLVN